MRLASNRGVRFLVPVYLLVAAMLLGPGCGGSGPTPIDRVPEAALGSISSEEGASPEDLTDAERAWQAWLDDPGVPGVDYDPSVVYVSYKRGAKLPQELRQVSSQLPADRRAAAQGNSLMRHDTSYEELTDVIAATFDLHIFSQVYNDYSITASFKVPEGDDHLKLADEIESRFPEFIEWTGFQPVYSPEFTPNDPDFLDESAGGAWKQWAQRRMDCEGAWEATQGKSGVLIAIVDDAFNLDHEELSNTILDPAVEFPSCQLDVTMGDNDVSPDDVDLHTHGTLCAGVAIAEGDNGRTIIGSGYGCQVVPIKCGKPGSQLIHNAYEGVSLAIDLALAGHNIRVISCSWGTLYRKPYSGWAPGRSACQRAYDNGILVIAAAGNDADKLFWNEDTQDYDIPFSPDLFVQYPAAYPSVLSVGAVRADLERTSYSNWGAEVNVSAGAGLRTCSVLGPSAYEEFHGTSCAAPVAAGAAAQLFLLDPSFRPGDVMDLLISTGDATTGFDPGPAVPFVNIGRAIGNPPPAVPYISGIELPAGNVFGPMPGREVFKARSLDPNGEVGFVRYEVVPAGSSDPLLGITLGAGVGFELSEALDFTYLTNQRAELRATPLDARNQEGTTHTADVVIFALPGDADADGEVTMADFELIEGKLGVEESHEDYSVFCDTDLDGVIRENDAAAVGYYCTETFPIPPLIESAIYDVDSKTLTVTVYDGNSDETLTVAVTEPPGLLVDSESKLATGTDQLIAEFEWSAEYETLIIGVNGETTVTVTDSTGLKNQKAVEIRMPGITLADDTLYAIPLETSVEVGEPVTVLVATGRTASPFGFLNAAALTIESEANYVPNSFNVGDIGGERWESDGLWLAMPDCEFLEYGDELVMPFDMGNGRERYSLNVTPINSIDVTEATGALLNLQFRFFSPGTYTLGFDHDQTFHSDSMALEHHWYDTGNDYPGIPNSVEVTGTANEPPVASLIADPESGVSPLEVHFDASGSTDPDGDDADLTFSWDFDSDGIIDDYTEEPTAVFTYFAPAFAGWNTCEVVVTDDRGASDSAAATVYVGKLGAWVWKAAFGSTENDHFLDVGVDSALGPRFGDVYALGRYWDTTGEDWRWEGLVVKYDPWAPSFEWGKSYRVPGGQMIHAVGNCGWVCDDGTLYIAGATTCTAGAGAEDMFLAKISASGSLLDDWLAGGTSYEEPYGLCVDSAGDVYLLSHSDSFSGGSGDYDVVLFKLDSSLNTEWVKAWGTDALEQCHGIHVTLAGDIFVTAHSTKWDSAGDAVLLHFTSAGNLDWAYRWSTAGHERFYNIVEDAAGDLIVCGVSNGAPAEGYDALVAKIDPDAVGGPAVLWARLYGSSGKDWVEGLATDSDGSIYLAGSRGDEVDARGVFAKLTSTGELIWMQMWDAVDPFPPPEVGSFFSGVAVDAADMVYVCGATPKAIYQNGSFSLVPATKKNTIGVWVEASGTVSSPSVQYVHPLGGGVEPATNNYDDAADKHNGIVIQYNPNG